MGIANQNQSNSLKLRTYREYHRIETKCYHLRLKIIKVEFVENQIINSSGQKLLLNRNILIHLSIDLAKTTNFCTKI